VHQTDARDVTFRRPPAVQCALVDRLFVCVQPQLHHAEWHRSSNEDIAAAVLGLLVLYNCHRHRLTCIACNAAFRADEGIDELRIVHVLGSTRSDHKAREQPHLESTEFPTVIDVAKQVRTVLLSTGRSCIVGFYPAAARRLLRVRY
jgi:hypothetical protein